MENTPKNWDLYLKLAVNINEVSFALKFIRKFYVLFVSNVDNSSYLDNISEKKSLYLSTEA